MAPQQGNAALDGLLLEPGQPSHDLFRQPHLQEAAVGSVQRLEHDLPRGVAPPEQNALFQALDELSLAVLPQFPLIVEPPFQVRR